MKHILIHGLGQDDQSWNPIKTLLNEKNMEVVCPNLFQMTSQDGMDYKTIYQAFRQFCNCQEGKVDLCGLSLGGILALDYVSEYPEKVNSIILIGTPYEIPKHLFQIQTMIFRFMPKATFKTMGCSKEAVIALLHSMETLDIKYKLDRIHCKSLILCGKKDKVNMKSAELLHQHIKESDFIIVDDASHEVNKDNPKNLSKIIYNFWKDEQ